MGKLKLDGALFQTSRKASLGGILTTDKGDVIVAMRMLEESGTEVDD